MLLSLLSFLNPNFSSPSSESGDGEGFDILHHILDQVVVPLPTVFGIDLSLTLHTLWMWGVAIVLMLLLTSLFGKKRLVPTGMANAFEAIVVFLREDVVNNYLGKDGRRFEPFILTIFFFILFNNLVGLVPGGATPTSDLSVTLPLAIMVFVVGTAAGMQANGVLGFWKGLIPSGVPGFILPLIAVLEVLSLFIKHAVLAMRLFANMTAGHIAILALISIIFIFQSWVITPFPIITAAIIGLLETLVSVLQAYIFTLLSSVFIGAALHQDH